VKKSDREIMEILEAFDATGCANSAASLAGVDPKTVRRYVAKRDAGKPVDEPVARPKLCLLYTSPSPRDRTRSRMPSSA
jgi:hypothetical protein